MIVHFRVSNTGLLTDPDGIVECYLHLNGPAHLKCLFFKSATKVSSALHRPLDINHRPSKVSDSLPIQVTMEKTKHPMVI